MWNRVLENIVLNHGSEGLFTCHSVLHSLLFYIDVSTWRSRWSHSTPSAGWHPSWSCKEMRSAGLWTSFSYPWCDLNDREREREKCSDLLWIILNISEYWRAQGLRCIHTRTFVKYTVLCLNPFQEFSDVNSRND